MFDLIKEDIKQFEKHNGKGLLPKIYYPMFAAVIIFRIQCFCYSYKVLRPISYLAVRLNDFMHGIWIGPRVEVGGGLVLAHSRGLVVNPDTKIGKNCTILQRVTFGGPGIVIGDNVLIGAGAQIISRRHLKKGIIIGDGAKIGAGALVLSDVPSNCTAVGNPAKIISNE